MTIECYFGMCSYHSSHSCDDGPFCYEPYCKATTEQLRLFAQERNRVLTGIGLPPEPNEEMCNEFNRWYEIAHVKGWKLCGPGVIFDQGWLWYWKALADFEENPKRGRPIPPHRPSQEVF